MAFAKCNDCHADPHTPRMTEILRLLPHRRVVAVAPFRPRAHEVSAARQTPDDGVRGVPRAAGPAGDAQVRHLRGLPPGSASRLVHADRAAPATTSRASRRRRSITRPRRSRSRASTPRPRAWRATRTSRAWRPAPDGRRRRRPSISAGSSATVRACHDDTHKGDLGASCETCHGTERFAVTTYAHRTPAPFFEGAHTPATCVTCHTLSGPAAMPALVRARTSAPPPSVPVGRRGRGRSRAPGHGEVHRGDPGLRHLPRRRAPRPGEQDLRVVSCRVAREVCRDPGVRPRARDSSASAANTRR